MKINDIEIILKRIPLDSFPEGRVQRESSHDDRIDPNKKYLVNKGNFWAIGHPSKAWYGWRFDVGSHLIQLNSVEVLYEFYPENLK